LAAADDEGHEVKPLWITKSYKAITVTTHFIVDNLILVRPRQDKKDKMRISAELLERAEVRMNPNLERELSLRGLGIPAIENMAAARDEFDAWDLSNNRIVRLENFPHLKRLKTLYVGSNLIEAIDARNIAENASSIQHLTLAHNNISALHEIVNIGKACPKLEFLSLNGNPVTSKYSTVQYNDRLVCAAPLS
jgi:U2 small nuclear ribonucleoprotein A'